MSLDVISLFTNIPTGLAIIDSVCKRWDLIAANCSVPRDEFISAIRFVLNSTFFTFNGRIYQQTYDTPMGSPLSPIIADIVLQDLEERAMARLTFTPPFYVRYVDVALAVPSCFLEHTLNVFNSFHSRIQFTMEIGDDNKFNFLDVIIILNNNRLIFDWFHKSTFSGRYLNFMSQHPICQKRGTVVGIIDRAFLLSHPQFHQTNLNFIINILLDNIRWTLYSKPYITALNIYSLFRILTILTHITKILCQIKNFSRFHTSPPFPKNLQL